MESSLSPAKMSSLQNIV